MDKAVDTHPGSTTQAQEPELWRGLEPTRYVVACFACQGADRPGLPVRQSQRADRFYVLCPAHGLQEVALDDLAGQHVHGAAASPAELAAMLWNDLIRTDLMADCFKCTEPSPLEVRRDLERARDGKPVNYVNCATHGLTSVYRRELRKRGTLASPWLDLEPTHFKGWCWICKGEMLDVRQTKGAFLSAKFFIQCPRHGVKEFFRRDLKRDLVRPTKQR